MLLSQRNCLLTFCCVLLSILQMAECRAFVSAKLEYYDSERNCDPPYLFNLAKCDLIFSLCLDRFSSSSGWYCYYTSSRTTRKYADQNWISFGSSEAFYIFSLQHWPTDIELEIRVIDKDIHFDDFVDLFEHNLQHYSPTMGRNPHQKHMVRLRGYRSTYLRLELSVYCERDYYGSDCRKFCSPGRSGHYSCSASGDKLCHSGWTGSTCNTRINYCLNVVCKNGGNCQRLSHGFRCSCPRGYEGQYCHVDTNECLNSGLCQGGACVNTPGSYTCKCFKGYSGKRCEIFTDVCDSKPCINGGTCKNVKGDYVCYCEDTFKGRNCGEDVDECLESNPCHNGSTCHNRHGSFMCECPVGLRGRTCSEDIDECIERSPCALGATCVNTPGSFSCQCLHGYTGELCDEDVNECSLSDDLCTYVGNFPPFTPNVTLFLERANMPTLSTNTKETKNSTEGFLFINGSSSDLPTSHPWPDAPVSHMLCVNTQPGYSCICQEGWMGTKCNQTLTEGPGLDATSAPEATYFKCQDHGVPKTPNKNRIQKMTVPFYLTGQLSLQTKSYVNSNLSRLLRESGLFEGKKLNLTCNFTHGITPSGKEITKVHPVLRVGGETLSDSELISVFRTLSTKETILVNWTLCTGDAKIIPSIIPDHDKTFRMWYLAPIIAGLLLLLVSVAGFVIYLRRSKNKPACEKPASREQQNKIGACFENAVYTENLENERKEKESCY